MSIYNGTLLQVWSGSGALGTWVQLATANSYTLTLSQATRDTSNKNSGGWESVASGRKSVELSTDSLMSDDASLMGYKELWNLADNRTTIKLVIGHVISDSGSAIDSSAFFRTGSFMITDISENAEAESNGTISCTFKLTGADFQLNNT